MMTGKRPGFRLEAAQLIVDQGYIVKGTVEALDVGKSTLVKCVRQLRLASKGATLTTITWLTASAYLTLQNLYNLNHCPGI
jgi:transposase-like protein